MSGRLQRKTTGVRNGFDESGYYKRLAANEGLRRETLNSLSNQLFRLTAEREILRRSLQMGGGRVAEDKLKFVLHKISVALAEIERIRAGKGKIPELKAVD